MGLTAEQRATRVHGIGGSEIAAIAGLNPYRGPLDVWLRKATPTRGPLVVENDNAAGKDPRDPDALKAILGHYMEPTLRTIYEERTGRKVRVSGTVVHPTRPHVFATPDGLIADEGGLEIKLVGARVAHHWDGYTLPDYVDAQARWGMACTGLPFWDVFALLGGTEIRQHTVLRDLEYENDLLALADDFWEGYVLADVAPDPTDEEARRAYLLQRYPGSAKTRCREDLGADETLTEIVAEREGIRTQIADLEEALLAIDNEVLAFIGNSYGVQGPWGKFIAPRIRGRVDWQAIAEELAGARGIDAALIEKHRGEGSRQLRFYGPPKRSKGRGR